MPTGKNNTHHNFWHPIHLTTFCTTPAIAKGEFLVKDCPRMDPGRDGLCGERALTVEGTPGDGPTSQRPCGNTASYLPALQEITRRDRCRYLDNFQIDLQRVL